MGAPCANTATDQSNASPTPSNVALSLIQPPLFVTHVNFGSRESFWAHMDSWPARIFSQRSQSCVSLPLMPGLILVFNNRGIIASTLMAHDVFISYARGDHSRAAQLASVLATKGWSVWWDRDILPGRTFDDVIEEALTNA